MQFIRTCINDCNSLHHCKIRLLSSRNASKPARLVDLSGVSVDSTGRSKGGIRGRISIVDIDGECPAYAALSHCWGSNLNDYKTTSTNLLQRHYGFGVQYLSPTFRDALEIARRLKIRYVWIDALCIVQDSSDEWHSESVKMGDIYGNAILTISASHAADGLGGCYNDTLRPRPEDKTKVIVMNYEDRLAGCRSSLIFKMREHPDTLPRELDVNPLNTRGWVFQERFLSPRIVHFTSTQVVWECREGYTLQTLVPLMARTVPSQMMRVHFMNETAAMYQWYKMVCDYSQRAFTRPKDRLVAIAGIAEIFQRQVRARYIAGLWSAELAYGLAWYTRLGAANRGGNKGVLHPTRRRHPTWSWASHDFQANWPSRDEWEYTDDPQGIEFLLEWVALELHQTDRGDFSPVVGGHIVVRGPVANVTHISTSLNSRQACDMQLEGNVEGMFRPDYKDDVESASKLTPDILALALRRSHLGGNHVITLILIPLGQGTGHYRRAGLGIVEENDMEIFGAGSRLETVSLF